MTRLNDTSAIVNKMPTPGPSATAKSLNVDVRPITNGYIVRESNYNDKDGYSCSETYSASHPMNKGNDKTGMMKSAVDHLNK